MKTLEQLIKEYIIEYVSPFGENIVAMGIEGTKEVARRYAKEVAKEALKNASENADTIEIPDAYGSTIDVVDKQSILNESNIPKL